jgi:LuxR family transcriptional regulator
MLSENFADYPDIASVPQHRRLPDCDFLSRLRAAVMFDHIAVSGLDLASYRFGFLNSVDSNFPPAFLEVYGAEGWHRSDPFVQAAKQMEDFVVEKDVFAISPPPQRLSSLLQSYGVFNRTIFPVRRSNAVFGAVTFTREQPFLTDEIDFLRRVSGLVHSEITRPLMERFGPQTLKLSEGELSCLELAARGMTSEEISSATRFTAETVNTYLKTATRKLSAKNRTHAVAEALRIGLVD